MWWHRSLGLIFGISMELTITAINSHLFPSWACVEVKCSGYCCCPYNEDTFQNKKCAWLYGISISGEVNSRIAKLIMKKAFVSVHIINWGVHYSVVSSKWISTVVPLLPKLLSYSMCYSFLLQLCIVQEVMALLWEIRPILRCTVWRQLYICKTDQPAMKVPYPGGLSKFCYGNDFLEANSVCSATTLG